MKRILNRKQKFFYHTCSRFRERFGIEYTGEIKRDIIRQINTGSAVCLGENPSYQGRIQYLASVKNKKCKVVYSKKYHEITTVLYV